MKINVLFFAQLREKFGSNSVLDLPEGSRIEDAARVLDLGALPLLFAVNEDFAEPNQALAPGDTLAFLMPVSGGAV